MANQSKSMVFGFVIIAAIIFAVALGYKMTQNTDSQVDKKQPVSTETVTTEDNSTPEIKVVSYDKPKLDEADMPTPEEQAEIEARSPFFMEFAMRFQNGTDAVNALPIMIENDQFEKAEFLVLYIKTHYPDTQIPEEFAEL